VLPKGDREREKLLRVAHSAADWAERMASWEQFAWEDAVMDAAEAGAELPTPPEPLPDLAPELIPLLREGGALWEKAFSSQDSIAELIAELMKPLELLPAKSTSGR